MPIITLFGGTVLSGLHVDSADVLPKTRKIGLCMIFSLASVFNLHITINVGGRPKALTSSWSILAYHKSLGGGLMILLPLVHTIASF